MLQQSNYVRMLASVRSIAEAKIVLDQGVDIIDLKEPSQGALGAVDYATASEVVKFVDHRVLVSATIGDLPDMQPQLVAEKVERMAVTNVDIIKIGIFPSPSLSQCIDYLYQYTQKGLKIVAVLFADLNVIDNSLLYKLAQRKFYGAMLDTAQKNKGSLLTYVPINVLGEFIKDCRNLGLMTGLAGSLSKDDISELLSLHPDYLGFRSALCGKVRTASIDSSCVKDIRDLIGFNQSYDINVPMG